MNKLLVNLAPLEDIVERLGDGDTRHQHIIDDYYHVDYVAPATGYPYSETVKHAFQINGADSEFPLKGTRPVFRLRYEFSNTLENTGSDNANRNNANVMKYLVKYSDNSVWVSDGTDLGPDYTAIPTGTKIADASENLRYVFVQLQGAGGGGGGNNGTYSGAGGGAGGYVVALIKLDHEASTYWKKNSMPITVGAGGSGGYHTAIIGGTIIPTGFGGDTGIPWNGEDMVVSAWGGDGGTSAKGVNSGTRGNGGSFRVGEPVTWATLVVGKDGATAMSGGLNDGNTNNHTNTYDGITTGRWTPDDQDWELSTPSRIVTASGYGGNGGSSPLGNGGNGGNGGGDGSGYGSGGGGSSNHISRYRAGGKGAGGYFAIYY